MVFLLRSAAASGAWVVTEVPQQAGWSYSTRVYDINDSGVACGAGNHVSASSGVAFRFDGTTVTELPYLHGSPPSGPYAVGQAINNSGVVAGWSRNAAGEERAVFWTGMSITQVPLPADADTNSMMRAYGINDAGVVVGFYRSLTTEQPAAYYYDGTTHSLISALQAVGLGLYDRQSYAEDLNSSGLICGWARDNVGTGYYNFYTYDIRTGTVTVLGKIIPTENYFSSAINDTGVVVGWGHSHTSSPIHAILHDGAFNIIDDTVIVNQQAKDITNAGRVVGHADIGSNRWCWYSDGPGSKSMHPVDLPGWTYGYFQGINADDVMVGNGRTAASGTSDRGLLVAPPPGDADHDGDLDLAAISHQVVDAGPFAASNVRR